MLEHWKSPLFHSGSIKMERPLKRVKIDHDYCKSIYSELRSLQQSQLLTDVTLQSGTVEVRAHRCVLAARSDYFRACLTSNMKESAVNSTIVLPLAHEDCLYQVINHIYGEEISITESNVMVLLDSANQLSIHTLKTQCCDFLSSTMCIDTCLQVHEAAEMYSCFTLARASIEYICENFKQLMKNSSFLDISENILTEFISSDSLCVPNELIVFQAIEAWISHDPDTRSQRFSDLLRHVRMELITSQDIAAHVHSCSYIKPSDMDILLRSYRYNALPISQRPYELSTRMRKDALRDCVFIIGGDNGVDDYTPFDSMRLLDLVAGEWVMCPPLPGRRSVAASAAFTTPANKKLIIAGGYDGSRACSTVQEYDLSTNAWKSLAPLKKRRCSCSGLIFEDEMYVIGGVCGPEALVSVEVYNPIEDTWTDTTPLNVS